MKKYILPFLFFVLSTQFSVAQQLQLSGEVKEVSSGWIYLQKFNNKIFDTVDSVEIKDGKFAFSSTIELPELYGLTLDLEKTPYYIFLQEGPITLQFDTAKYYQNTAVQGSVHQDRYLEFRKRTTETKIEDFIAEDPESIVSAYILYRNYAYRLTPEKIREHTRSLSASLQNSQYVRVLNDLSTTMETVMPGKIAPDFISHNPEGEPVRFSDHLGNGYVLLDFWAAWCGPCRKENPNVVAAFEKYRDKGFSVFGVSLDRKKEHWEKAIAQDGLNWTQVSELDFWNSKAAALYGVRAIPSNFLIGPDGEIVARDLKGQKLIDTLEELLNPTLVTQK